MTQIKGHYSDREITATYRAANAENVAAAKWLVDEGICLTTIEAARFLGTPAGQIAATAYRFRSLSVSES